MTGKLVATAPPRAVAPETLAPASVLSAATPGLPAGVKAGAGKLFIKTQGCQMNVYDSAKMADVLAAEHGLELTDNEFEADVILINTCSIREKANTSHVCCIQRMAQRHLPT